MKKILVTMLVVCLCLCMFTACDKEEEIKVKGDDGIFCYELNDSKTGYEVYPSDGFNITAVVIPDSYNGLPVTIVTGFGGCWDIKSVVIPDSVTTI